MPTAVTVIKLITCLSSSGKQKYYPVKETDTIQIKKREKVKQQQHMRQASTLSLWSLRITKKTHDTRT